MKSKKEMLIYVIINKFNSKKYVGSTIDYKTRKKSHLNLLKKGIHHSNYLQNSYNKYGKANFEFKILEYVHDVNSLIKVEQKWIDYYKPLLNMTQIAGLNCHLGIKRSEKTKKKISDSLTGRKLTPEHIEAMRQGLIGNKHSEETKEKRSQSCKNSKKFQEAVKSTNRNNKIKKTRLKNGGYIVTDEMKSKISEKLKSKKLQSAISVKISKFNLKGVFIETYPSILKAEKENGLGVSSLHYNIVKKNKKIYKGFIWKIEK